MLRFLRYILEFIAAFVGVGIVLGFLLVWRLNAKPISSDFLIPYIEAGIESIVPHSKVHLGSTLLTWSSAEAHYFRSRRKDRCQRCARPPDRAHSLVFDAKIT